MNKLRFLVPALIASAVVAGNGNLGAMNSNSGDSSADTDTVIPADTIVPDTPRYHTACSGRDNRHHGIAQIRKASPKGVSHI